MHLFMNGRQPGRKRWVCVGSGSSTTPLRVHAALYPADTIDQALQRLRDAKSGLEFKAVPSMPPARRTSAPRAPAPAYHLLPSAKLAPTIATGCAGKNRDGGRRAAPSTAETMKQALLAVGTDGRFVEYAANNGTGMHTTWALGTMRWRIRRARARRLGHA